LKFIYAALICVAGQWRRFKPLELNRRQLEAIEYERNKVGRGSGVANAHP
jgi:hypothetical protein